MDMKTLPRNGFLQVLFFSTMLLCGTFVKPAFAEVIDRIQINQAGDQAEISIRFITRIQYVRQLMLKNGDIRIYFNLLEIDGADPRLVWQRRDSPPSKIAPHFSVTYPEIDASLSVNFGKPLEYYVRPGNDGRSISIFIPVIKPATELSVDKPLAAPEAPPSQLTPPAGPSEAARPAVPAKSEDKGAVEQGAKRLLDKANAAIAGNSYVEAINLLKQLLALPANQQTQASQLLLGNAYEKNGEFVKARNEYSLYIKQYPKAKDIKQAQGSLARVFMAAYQAEKPAPEKMAIQDSMVFAGGISQNYSRSLSHVDSTALPSSVVTSSDSVDQSQLLSSIDLTGWKRTETTDTRLVFRDTYIASFIPSMGSSNSLNAAYVEQGASDQSYLYRAGRQTGTTSGVPNRFDGAWVSGRINPIWQVNGSLGSPVLSPHSTAEHKAFATIGVDMGRAPGQWGGNAYLTGQRVGNVLDRRATGMEARFFNANSNYMGFLEYDTLFKKVNAGLFQGSWANGGGSNYVILMEHRRNLQLTNALLLYPNESIKSLLESGARANSLLVDARAASPIFNQFMLGGTQSFSPRLKFGGDFRVANTTSYMAFDPLLNVNAVIPGIRVYTYSLQMTGNNLLFSNDLGIVNASYTKATTYKARALTFSQVVTWQQYWKLSAALQYYVEDNMLAGYQHRLNPSFNCSYRLNKSVNFEAGGGVVQTLATTPTLVSNTRRKYFNLGYRWDFQ